MRQSEQPGSAEQAPHSLAAELDARGLAAPAELLLDAHRLLRPLLADLATFVAPLAGPLLGERIRRIRPALDDEAACDALLRPDGER